MSTIHTHDAVILGGGLAGLTLALQLKGEYPDLDVLVLERQRHPLPEAAHKVGESTVEISAHYFAETLGLREHLDSAHVHKFGFRFFFSDGRDDLDNVSELGVRKALPTPTWQLDRGIFENFLGIEARRRGIDFRDDTRIVGLETGVGDTAHSVRFRDGRGDHEVSARWLLDASGRAGLLRRRFELTRDNGHAANAAWFRLDDRIDIDGWSDNSAWRNDCTPPERWRSTNHLMGPGYWAWLVALSSGAHSIGIVADAGMHPIDGRRNFERTLDWLGVHQPALARAVAARRETLLDFAFLRNYSYSCSRMFSADRWALTGEAGAFLDPFYSPGSDFIAIANTYICALVGQDRAGHNLAPYAHFYEQLFFSFYENTLCMFRGQYPLFGDPEVMPNKVLWDYAYYWGILCPLVFNHRLTDLDLLGAMRPQLERVQALNQRMQMLFRQWHAVSDKQNQPGMLDQGELDWFVALNAGLHDPLDDAGVRNRLCEHAALLEALADALTARAARRDVRLHAPLSGRAMPPLFGNAA